MDWGSPAVEPAALEALVSASVSLAERTDASAALSEFSTGDSAPRPETTARSAAPPRQVTARRRRPADLEPGADSQRQQRVGLVPQDELEALAHHPLAAARCSTQGSKVIA
ncbi:hypothetical protein EYF80_053377 [Liparis tanakae]|uniref:Uncharacterized protein n=1 Tax=Liparis tanakae TaxID=230148 RepID=A0A4Z2F5M5_9TELE|nr:hypothetical protein EYF80_053377 [Liparis tanakae]